MLLWWAVLYPGTFTNDSVTVINQIRSGTWDDWHTNAYTSFVWFTSLNGNFWAMTTLAQVVLMSFGISSLASAILAQGVSRSVVGAASALLASSPQVGAFAITLWKDVPSAAGALMLAAALLNLGRNPRPKADQYVFLAAGALLVGAFRWNGPIALAILGATLAYSYRSRSLPVLTVVAGVLAISVSSLILPQRLNLASSTASTIVNVTQLHDIAYTYATNPTAIDDRGRSVLESVMPIENWENGGGTCETVDVLLFENIYEFAPESLDSIRDKRTALRILWFNVIRRSPLESLTARICRAAGVWSPFYFGKQPTLGLAYLPTTDPELARRGDFPAGERFLIPVIRMTSSSELSKSLVLNAMLWTLIALVLALRKKSISRLYLRCLPVGIAVMVSVMLGAVAHDSRYVAGALLIAQFFVLVSVLDWVRNRLTISRSRRA